MTLYTKFPLMKHLFADIILNLSMKDSGMKKNKKAQKNKKNRNTEDLEVTLGTDRRAMCPSAPLDFRSFFFFLLLARKWEQSTKFTYTQTIFSQSCFIALNNFLPCKTRKQKPGLFQSSYGTCLPTKEKGLSASKTCCFGCCKAVLVKSPGCFSSTAG